MHNFDYRIFVARSGEQIRDQLIKALTNGCADVRSRGYERVLRALGTSLNTRSRKYRFQKDNKPIVTTYYKSALAIYNQKAVGIVFIEKDTVWVYVNPEHRRNGLAQSMMYEIIRCYPVVAYQSNFKSFLSPSEINDSNEGIIKFFEDFYPQEFAHFKQRDLTDSMTDL